MIRRKSLRKSIWTRLTQRSQASFTIVPATKKQCTWIAIGVIIQCTIFICLATTVLACIWVPVASQTDYNKLVRVMYLYDHTSCGHKMKEETRAIPTVLLANESGSIHNISPVKSMIPIAGIATSQAFKSRTHVSASMGLNAVWLVTAIIMLVAVNASFCNNLCIKVWLRVFFYVSIIILIFDVSMGIVYLAHIRRSLTNGVVLRYSGWSIEMRLTHYNQFAGWIPIVAGICWLRFVFILGLNVYHTRFISRVLRSVKKKESTMNRAHIVNREFPEVHSFETGATVLYFQQDMYGTNYSSKQKITQSNVK